ncbi:MAG: hypothetical protein ABI333_06780 [bacterium]
MRRSLEVSETLAINALVVHALDDAARAFYKRYGFHSLLDGRLHLFLGMSTIRRAFS